MAEGEIGTLIAYADTAKVQTETANLQTEATEIHADQALVRQETTEIGTFIKHAETANVQTEGAVIHAEQALVRQEITAETLIQSAERVDLQAETAGITYAQNVYIQGAPRDGSGDISDLQPSGQSSLDKKHVQDFLKAVRHHTLQNTKAKVNRQFKDLQRLEEEISPKLTVVQMTGKTEEKDPMKSESRSELSKNKSDKVVGSDLYEIQFHQLHNDHEGKAVNHVMILGDPGEGKSVSAMRYAQLVSEKEVESLEDVKLVHFVQVSKLQCTTPSTAFDLLFSQQIGHDLSEELALAGQKWLKENASKVLLVLDGLDQSRELFAGDFPNIDSKIPAKTNTILANLFSGHLYPGMKILSTARWHTYWNLKDEQIPHKTVALRGFDDSKIEQIIPELCGEEMGKKILEFLSSQALDLRSLCTTPLFLSCVAQVLMRDLSNSPDTLSGIMVGVLRYFSSSGHAKSPKKHLQSYMKLAFNGIKDNRFIFSLQYVESLGLDVKDLQDILSTDAKLDDLTSEAEEEDLELFFYHQTIQEVLAALYVCNIAAEEFKQHLEKDLTQPQMEVVRKFVYGILLNENTWKLAERYLPERGRKDHAAMAYSHLKKLLGQDAVRDVKIILLMQECGSKVIKDLQPMIKRIHVSKEALKPSEMYPVISVVRECTPLSSVTVQNVKLDPAIIALMQSVLKSTRYFQIEEVVIGEQLQHSDCSIVMGVIHKVRIAKLTFRCSNKVMSELCRRINSEKPRVQISEICIEHNKSLEASTFSLLPDVVRVVRPKTLQMEDCDLTDEKLREFIKGIGEESMKIQVLSVNDNKSMDLESFHVLAEIVGKANIDHVCMRRCDLTTEKLQAFSENLSKVKILQLEVSGNKTMEAAAYKIIAEIVTKTKVEKLFLHDVDLAQEKLECFRDNIKTKIEGLSVDDNKSMDPESFHVLAEIVGKANIDIVCMAQCDLTTEKLQRFSENLSQVKILQLEVGGNKTMEAAAYKIIAEIVTKTKVEKLWMKDVDLTQEKLECFRDNIKTKMEMFIIDKNKTMEPGAFAEVANIMNMSSQLYVRNCDLNAEQLDVLCKNLKVKVEQIRFDGNKSMDLECFQILAKIAGKIWRTVLNDVDLTTEKFQTFCDQLDKDNAEAYSLSFDRDESPISDEEFSSLCKIIPRVTAAIYLKGWVFNSEQQKKMQSQLDSSAREEFQLFGQDENGKKVIMSKKKISSSRSARQTCANQ